jgi:mRNA-degrading endonuclease RelE of RelBE toxin-antitoxin system
MKQEGQKRYRVEWSKKAKKNLNKIDPTEKDIIIYKVENKLANDPYGKKIDAKPLKGEARKGQ